MLCAKWVKLVLTGFGENDNQFERVNTDNNEKNGQMLTIMKFYFTKVSYYEGRKPLIEQDMFCNVLITSRGCNPIAIYHCGR